MKFGYWTPAWDGRCPVGHGYQYARVALGWDILSAYGTGIKQPIGIVWRHSRHPSLTDHYGRPLPQTIIQPATNYALGVEGS